MSVPLAAAALLVLQLDAGSAQLAGDEGDVGQEEAIEHFEKHVRPVLVEHCVQCHGGEKPKGGLRLDTAEGIGAGAFGEPIAVAGDLGASLIIEAVRYEDPLYAMPPSGKLPDDAIQTLERWVELGAVVPERIVIEDGDLLGWSLTPPVPMPLAEEAAAQDWIDLALAARLEEQGIEVAEPASPSSWLRRVTFDLTGLPPTESEWRAFSRSAGGPADREAVVDRLLASPAFGERWARRWLDLVRYAETRAHEFDFAIPNAYQYRDYVIRAFEADVPYDRFITELLAGDLVTQPRLDPTGTFDESVLGTGAWFLGEEVHSPVEPRGDQSDRIAHQVEVLSKSVLALGVACARCHDHKFDPISAEDYHALGGFALSTAARQVRFETDGHNRELSGRIQRFLEGGQNEFRSAVAGALRDEAAGLAPLLVQLAQPNEPTGPAPGTSPALELSRESVARLDARFSKIAGAGTRPALLIEDFEAATLAEAALGPWEREGEAFLDRPVRAADTASQGTLVPRGKGSLNSYASAGNSDRPKGQLTSQPFPAVRRFLHLLINGGDGPGVRVDVLDEESGAVIGSARAKKTNALNHAKVDLTGYEGALLRVRFVDEESGSWGQIGGDHLVLADEPEASALDVARGLGSWEQLLNQVTRSADDLGGDAEARLGRILAWTELLGGNTGTALDWLRAPPTPREPADGPGPRTLVDYGHLTNTRWIVNGPGFGAGPYAAGSVVLDVDPQSLEAKVAAITVRNAAVGHPMWDDLVLSEGTRSTRGGSFNWVQAGRTLLSPTFKSDHGRLAHLVRGRANALLVLAGHKMIAGPLHTQTVRKIDTGGAWRWVVQNVPTSAGFRSHLEFTALGGGTFEIAETIDLGPGEALPEAPGDESWLFERIDAGDVEFSGLGDRAAWIQGALGDAARLLEMGGIRGRSLSDAERSILLSLAEHLARHHPGVRAGVARRLQGAAQILADLRDERALRSGMAPAAIDLEGVDERILDRGSWRSPGAAAPRRAPAVLRVSQRALAREGEGSGRLRLADSLLKSPTKIVQRVWVNRLWQAMFSAGLVATPDDFGAMGAKPSHPEILDQLALDFEEDGWSTKGLLRRLALSEAYGRSTVPTPSAAAKDPSNVGLSRMHVRRLEAEEIRDGLLAVSGELRPERLGPPVPIHLTAFMDGRGRPSSSGPLDGAGRRSIYLEVRRNFPHPFLTVFDWPNPATCRGRRSSSNVPAQALTMLNDPFVEDRAEHLADLILGEAQDGADEAEGAERLDSLWLRVLGRLPTPGERDLARAALSEGGDPRDAWVDLVHVLFNLKDFLFLK